MIQVLFKCEHCSSFYELKSRALDCAKKDIEKIKEMIGDNHDYKIMVSKYRGSMTLYK